MIVLSAAEPRSLVYPHGPQARNEDKGLHALGRRPASSPLMGRWTRALR